MKRAFQFSLRSDLNNIKDVVAEAIFFLKEQSLKIDFYGFKLVLTEALNNAVIHGNQQDPRLKVKGKVEVRDNSLKIHITDQGNGFDWRMVKDLNSSIDEDPLREGGRGLKIFTLYGYDFTYRSNGCELQLKRALDAS